MQDAMLTGVVGAAVDLPALTQAVAERRALGLPSINHPTMAALRAALADPKEEGGG